MKRSPPGEQRLAPDPPLLVALFVVEACFVILAIGISKQGDRSVVTFVATRAGAICVLALAALVVALAVIVARRRIRRNMQRFAIALNLIFVAVGLGTSELLIRMIVVRAADGTSVMGRRLLPLDWHDVRAHNQAILREASATGSYLVFDPILGWDVGHGRASANGLYFSSAEGLRSARAGERLTRSAARARVAIIGDSFTFGLEVAYEDSWGQQLEQQLGEEAQVLNFGVDGYGVDQAYLKYLWRVRAWGPDVVIFSMVDQDLERTMGVYAFLTFPGSYLPFPKPRIVVDQRGPTIINLPLPPPAEMFSAHSIRELPFVGLDRNYDPWEWEWHVYHRAYVVRFVQSMFPRWALPRPEISDEQMRRLNGQLLRAFVRDAVADHAIPVVVYFPHRTQLLKEVSPGRSLAPQVLHAAGIPYLDMTECVQGVEPRDRFVVLHYSPLTSRAIAGCLRDVVRQHLASIGK